MSKITPYLFNWQEVEAKSDLNRLKLVLETIPDERLMMKLERHRGKGRNDYPVRCVWNAILAGLVFQHSSIESLRRELARNAALRQMCGFDPFLGSDAVPKASAFTHFLNNLFRYAQEVERIFDELVEELSTLLPDFGKHLAVDSKAIWSAGKPNKKTNADGRRDIDADWGVKEYKGKRLDGTLWKNLKRWFGYKFHILVDTTYEIPLSFEVTRGSASDVKQLIPLMEKHLEKHPKTSTRREILTGDRAYDDTKTIQQLYDDYGVKPVIDIRDCWKEGGDEVDREEGVPVTRQLNAYDADNIVYDYRGNIYCICLKTLALQNMAFGGFEQDRNTLKYLCPVKAYGMTCHGMSECRHRNKSIRIPLSLNRRIFTPLARSSYKWASEYKSRTAVERVNSRLDMNYGFEKHFFRGIRKMRIRLNLAMIVMLSMAVGHIKSGRKEVMRSLVRSPTQVAKAA